MQSKIVCVCLFVCVFGALHVLAQVASLCRPNERLLSCGCPKTCRDPAPDCKGMCKEGCFCEEGEVRNETGHCVKLTDCPPVSSKYKLETSEPRYNGGICPENEEYKFCESCLKTCENPNPICPAQCSRGCFCKGNLLRDKDGRCVKPAQCSNIAHLSESPNLIKPLPYQINCGEHQVYKDCESCEKTCSDPKPICSAKPACKNGCYCDEGYVRAPSGNCVKLHECPKAEISHTVHEPTVEDCAPDEVYLSCGWCEPTCSDPAPSCPARVCTRGCLCRPPLLRHRSGLCVEERDCLPHQCKEPNEEYVCRYGCEPRCDRRHCSIRPFRCELKCHCRLGLLRDIVTGLCVTEDKCFKIPVVTRISNNTLVITVA